MNLRDIPEDALKIIFKELNNSSLYAISQANRFFSDASRDAVIKRKIEYINSILSYCSNELSLEKIKEHVDFLVKESSLTNAARCLILVIQNAEEKVKEARRTRSGDEFQIFISNDPEAAEEKYQFQKNRLADLIEYYNQKLGLFGQIFKLIYAIEYDHDESRYEIALELLHLIKLGFANEHHPDIVKVLNDFNKDKWIMFKNYPDFQNDYMFLGRTESLIAIDETTMEIKIGEIPIDDVIKHITQQKLPYEVADNALQAVISQLEFMGEDIGIDTDFSENSSETAESIINAPEFQERLNFVISEADSRAHHTMEEIIKISPQSGNSLKM